MKADTAETIRAVWREVLQVDTVDADDDFFDIGGHSLSAMQVASRLRAELGGVKVPTQMLFRHRTFAAFTAAVDERVTNGVPA